MEIPRYLKGYEDFFTPMEKAFIKYHLKDKILDILEKRRAIVALISTAKKIREPYKLSNIAYISSLKGFPTVYEDYMPNGHGVFSRELSNNAFAVEGSLIQKETITPYVD